MRQNEHKTLKNLQNILVYRIGNLGDTVVSLPAMWAVRKQFPAARMVLLGNSNGRHVVARSVLPETGLFDDWLIYPSATENKSSKFSTKLLELIVRLRREKFDALIYLAPRERTAKQVQRDLLFFRLAGIKRFFGHAGFIATPAKKLDEPLPFVVHEADHLLDRLKLTGIETPLPNNGSMNLNLSAGEIKTACDWLEQHCAQERSEKRLVAIAPGSKWTSKIWFEKDYAELGRRLIAEFDLFPIVFGGKEDFELGERLIAVWKRGANSAGLLSVRESAAALAECQLFVGNDTGSIHLAAAVDVPCVGIYAALHCPGHWHPYGRRHTVLRAVVPCEGCFLFECPNNKICLRAISIEDAAAACRVALERSLSANPASIKTLSFAV